MSFLHSEPALGQSGIINPSFAAPAGNAFMDEPLTVGEHIARWINNMAEPVNNFLKDPTEMEREFRKEVETDSIAFRTHPRGKIIPIDEALKGCMEQNY